MRSWLEERPGSKRNGVGGGGGGGLFLTNKNTKKKGDKKIKMALRVCHLLIKYIIKKKKNNPSTQKVQNRNKEVK